MKIDNVTLIIRSVGERTEGLCNKLIKNATGVEPIIIKETPFSKALKVGLEKGITKDRKWTLCTDADVLVDIHGLRSLFAFAEKTRESVFKVTPQFFDKFFDTHREGGVHLYRTKYLKEAVELIPEEGVDLRPETYMLSRMRDRGYELERPPLVVGIHDFEQFYEDIFRKGYVHSHKWSHKLHELLPLWRSKAIADKDFEVLLAGVAAGIATLSDYVRVDLSRVPYDLMQTLLTQSINEKELLGDDNFDLGELKSLTEFAQKIIAKNEAENMVVSKLEQAKLDTEKKKNLGWLKYYLIYLPAQVLERIGLKIKWELYDKNHIAGLN